MRRLALRLLEELETVVSAIAPEDAFVAKDFVACGDCEVGKGLLM